MKMFIVKLRDNVRKKLYQLRKVLVVLVAQRALAVGVGPPVDLTDSNLLAVFAADFVLAKN